MLKKEKKGLQWEENTYIFADIRPDNKGLILPSGLPYCQKLYHDKWNVHRDFLMTIFNRNFDHLRTVITDFEILTITPRSIGKKWYSSYTPP